MSNSDAALREDLITIFDKLFGARKLEREVAEIVKSIMPLLCGHRVTYGGAVFQIVSARVVMGQVHLTGVRCRGKIVGTRQFFAGYLNVPEMLKELNDGEQQQQPPSYQERPRLGAR